MADTFINGIIIFINEIVYSTAYNRTGGGREWI